VGVKLRLVVVPIDVVGGVKVSQRTVYKVGTPPVVGAVQVKVGRVFTIVAPLAGDVRVTGPGASGVISGPKTAST